MSYVWRVLFYTTEQSQTEISGIYWFYVVSMKRDKSRCAPLLFSLTVSVYFPNFSHILLKERIHFAIVSSFLLIS